MCRAYLKTLTTLTGTPADQLMLEDLASVDLDLAALQHGYRRPDGLGHATDIAVVERPGLARRILAWRGRAGSMEPGRPVRPAEACAGLLAALDASEGRTRRRKRDQTPDRIGLGIKRDLLERAVREDPDPDAFEGWLLGPFRQWLARGAPSDDAGGDPAEGGPCRSADR